MKEVFKMSKKNRSLFTIRKKKKERHPQIIVGADRTSFKSIGLTHSKRSGKSINIPLKNNPNKNDDSQAYAKRRIVKDFKFRFSKAFKNYHLSNEDIEELQRFLESKKRK